MRIDGKNFIFTDDAWRYLQQKEASLKQKKSKIKKVRKNATKRKDLSDILISQVHMRSDKYCENDYCINKAKDIHHLLPVRLFPELQFELWNLIYLCRTCHRSKHPELPDSLFPTYYANYH